MEETGPSSRLSICSLILALSELVYHPLHVLNQEVQCFITSKGLSELYSLTCMCCVLVIHLIMSSLVESLILSEQGNEQHRPDVLKCLC